MLVAMSVTRCLFCTCRALNFFSPGGTTATGENLIETIWRRNVFDINHISFGINRFSSVLHPYEQTECHRTEKFIGPILIQAESSFAKTVCQKILMTNWIRCDLFLFTFYLRVINSRVRDIFRFVSQCTTKRVSPIHHHPIFDSAKLTNYICSYCIAQCRFRLR